MTDVLSRLPGVLLPWYDEGHRDLPWRHDREPYHIWLSEIMLQQTRAEAVKGYYARFLDALPTIEALSRCDDDALHKLWEGLGYYSRVRNLKKAAIAIMENYGGVFPRTFKEVLALPGIGDYTAGAICSIAFGLPTPAVDGNVLRVIARITDDDTPIDLPACKKAVREQLEAIYPDRAGDFTQALMELGATLCGPNWVPRCGECPCREFCQARKNGTAEKLPVKLPKKGRRLEDMTLFIAACDGRYAIRKRPGEGLLADLWEFPHVPGKLDAAEAMEAAQQLGLKPVEIFRSLDRKHIFTHIQWQMRGYFLEVTECTGGLVWLTAEDIRRDAALPTAFRQFWEEIDHV